jgi:hypothetical protein
VIQAHADPAFIPMRIVDAVGDGLATRPGNDEVVRADTLRRLGRPPPSAAILEGPHQFLLLGVDRDRRLLPALDGPDLTRDGAKLRIPIGVLPTFASLDVALQAVAEAVQQLGDHRVADGMTERLKGQGQGARAQAGPPQGRLRIARRRRFDQRLQVAQQRGLRGGRPLPPRAGLARTRATGKGTSASSSVSPRPIVAGESPVARATSAMPPYPRARASVAAHKRRDRSVQGRMPGAERRERHASPYHGASQSTSRLLQLS